jgi:hypothetical protein
MRKADSMSTTRFSSRERDRLCINSSSWLRCKATSPKTSLEQGQAGGTVFHRFLRLFGPRFGLQRLLTRVGALTRQLLLNARQLLPQKTDTNKARKPVQWATNEPMRAAPTRFRRQWRSAVSGVEVMPAIL